MGFVAWETSIENEYLYKTLLLTHVKRFCTFVVQSIVKTWEAIKPFLSWKEASLRFGLLFSDHYL